MNALEQARVTLNNLSKKTTVTATSLVSEDVINSCLVFRQGNFTAALINGAYLGIAKRNCKEDPKGRKLTGDCYAISRAVHALIEGKTGAQ